ncbi:hypothetical protein F5X96DRAFT_669496 [Biscogniauxia mediterranea]|nr:hypothetical protein F5X96DRAFT_669496 [Biscogniauxia mediterranea]
MVHMRPAHEPAGLEVASVRDDASGLQLSPPSHQWLQSAAAEREHGEEVIGDISPEEMSSEETKLVLHKDRRKAYIITLICLIVTGVILGAVLGSMRSKYGNSQPDLCHSHTESSEAALNRTTLLCLAANDTFGYHEFKDGNQDYIVDVWERRENTAPPNTTVQYDIASHTRWTRYWSRNPGPGDLHLMPPAAVAWRGGRQRLAATLADVPMVV